MPVVRCGYSLSFWIYTLLFASLQLWGRILASTAPSAAPAPVLEVSSRSSDSVVLICRAPAGHLGVLFSLYRVTEPVDSVRDEHGAVSAQFTVRVEKQGSVQQDLYCCLFQTSSGLYSAVSPYLVLEHQQDAAPTRPPPSFPPPVLSVEPSSGQVKRGEMLSFRCSVSLPQPQSQPRSRHNNPKPAFFILLRTAEVTGETSMVVHPQAMQVSNSKAQPGAFSVGPVTGGEGGSYACIYQITRRRTLINSTISNMVHISITDLLPVPTLTLQQQKGVWHLLCSGSPAYPGAVFTLYLAGNKIPVASHHAPFTHYQAFFPMPVQDAPSAQYQCQYSALLGKEWSSSEYSLPLAVSIGNTTTAAPGLPAVDWPLVLGSFSAVVLFFCAVALVVVVAHRKVQAAADEKKKRKEAQFWTQVHSKDHVVDLTLRRDSFSSQGWANEGRSAETASRSPLWNPLSTFTNPY
ncbi:uncharacterized protein LOC115358291 [Myripristis murdjan]|uniref:uncharacterized protein LOC115358291 n=1 Tax=Myripristis murdjan TaxID=586833 RepID=UPI0011763F90|nr:uncharacterized protein LOC115358291 [Myripristis murdjan]